MYTYIVERTQIYLSREEATALDREAKRRGQTRSHLIREAIDRVYLSEPSQEEVLEALDASFGAWKNRSESGEEYVERIGPATASRSCGASAGWKRTDPTTSEDRRRFVGAHRPPSRECRRKGGCFGAGPPG